VCDEYQRRVYEVLFELTPEEIPILMVSAAKNTRLVDAAAVFDARQVVGDTAQVREFGIVLWRTQPAAP